MWIDNIGLNKESIEICCHLSLILGLVDQLGDAKIYTNIDLRGAYNLIRIKKGDKWNIAFRIRYGQFKYNTMPFWLTNALAVFQHMMNNAFQEFLDQFLIIYIDDILIFSKNEKEHKEHVCLVLQKLCEMKLYATLEKCMFHQLQVEFLWYIISKMAFWWILVKLLPFWNGKFQREYLISNFLSDFFNFYQIFI